MSLVQVPGPRELMRPTLRCLAAGRFNSDEMRARLTRELRLKVESLSPQLARKFVNNHAWSLVRLQQAGLISRLDRKHYSLTEAGKQHLRQPDVAAPIEAPRPGFTPSWAKRLIYRANRMNGSAAPRFTEEDLLALWKQAGGRCEITRLPFSDEKVGGGKAKRAFAPSLDRVDPQGPYARANCRLVMVAVNFALNAWGEEVYRQLAEASTAAWREEVEAEAESASEPPR